MRRLLILALLTLLGASISHAQTCHVVGPSGSSTGLDFAHPMAVPSSNGWQRGHVYYFLPGTYPSKPQLGTANSGTTVITLLRATNTDHGQNCTPSVATGYIDSTMGQPAGKATFRLLEILSGYWTIDGVFPNSNTGIANGYGFFTDASVCAPGSCWPLNVNNGGNWDHITIKNYEVLGQGDAATAPGNLDDLLRIAPSGAVSTYTFQYLYLHNSSSTCWKILGADNVTITQSTCEHNFATGAFHSEVISSSGGAHWVVSFNIFKDVMGTGAIVQLNSNSANPSTANDWLIYGNLIYTQAGNPTGRGAWGNGVISCINNQSWTNVKFVNNTIANMIGSTRIFMPTGADNCASSTGLIVKDNLWYNNGNGTLDVSPFVDSAQFPGFDYNSYLKNTVTTGDTGSQTISNGTAPNPFVNTTQAVPTDYKLSGNTNATPWLNLNATIPGNAVDLTNTTRALSRGTFEFVGTTIVPPNPPTGLTSSVSGSTVTLTGTASTGSPVPTGYTLYRGTVHGGPYSIVKTGLSSPNTTDTPPNGTFFYTETAFVGGLVSTINGNGTTATVTCLTSCASFPNGTAFTIFGDSVAGFNGTFTSTSQPTSSTFTFSSATNSVGSGGAAWPTAGESVKSNEVQATVPAALTVTLLPASRVFGNQTVGTSSASQAHVLTNTSGSGGTVTISLKSITGTNLGDFSETDNCPASLLSGNTCTFNITFTPTAGGSRVASLNVFDNASGSPQSVALSGTGVVQTPGVNLNPTSLNFGDQTLSTTSTVRSIILTNTGSGVLTITSVVASGDFAVVTVPVTNCGGTLASLATCSLNVTFTPTATGGRTGAITVTDNAAGNPHVANLSGNGITTKCQFTGNVTLSGTGTVCQ